MLNSAIIVTSPSAEKAPVIIDLAHIERLKGDVHTFVPRAFVHLRPRQDCVNCFGIVDAKLVRAYSDDVSELLV